MIIPPPRVRVRLLALCLMLSLCCFLAGCREEKTPAVPQNIMLITIDSLRADHLGCYGYKRNTTPNIDALAQKATRFENAYSPSSWTQPSIASLFTSLHPRDHGIRTLGDTLGDRFVTLAEHLKQNGYDTQAFVSLLLMKPQFGYCQGFDDCDYSVIEGRSEHAISTSREITDKTIDYLKHHREKPFFCWTYYYDPHFNYLVHKGHVFEPPEGIDILDPDVEPYDSEIAFTDHHIGRLLKKMKKMGLLRNTIVVIAADHGEEFNDHHWKYHGHTVYQELVHIPLIIYTPGIAPGAVDETVTVMDIAPTLLQLLNLSLPEQYAGHAIPVVSGSFAPPSPQAVFFETFNQAQWYGAKIGKWKLVYNLELDKRRLFDLEQDPTEQLDLQEEDRELTERIQKEMKAFFAVESGYQPARTELTDKQIEKLKSMGYLR